MTEAFDERVALGDLGDNRLATLAIGDLRSRTDAQGFQAITALLPPPAQLIEWHTRAGGNTENFSVCRLLGLCGKITPCWRDPS